jgi:outer membrane protein OmpA-like peptidoglycan-associated protein
MRELKRTFAGCLFGLTVILVLFPCTCALADDCLKAQKDYEQALGLKDPGARRDAFEEILKDCPSLAGARVNLADSLEQLANHARRGNQDQIHESEKLLEEAKKQYLEALKRNPKLASARAGLAGVYFQMGLYRQAKAELEQAKDPDRTNDNYDRSLKCVADMIDRENQLPTSLTKEEIIAQVRMDPPNSCVESIMKVSDNRTAAWESRLKFEIPFEGWKYEVTLDDAKKQLKQLAAALESSDLKNMKIFVEGHCNVVGGEKENDLLSWNRAKHITTYLVEELQIGPERISYEGFGYHRLKVPEKPTDAANRRAEILFIPPRPKIQDR